MSNKFDDQVNDYVESNELDMLEEYLESNNHFIDFTDWLYDKAQDELRKDLLVLFLTSKASKRFYAWASDRAVERVNQGKEYEHD